MQYIKNSVKQKTQLTSYVEYKQFPLGNQRANIIPAGLIIRWNITRSLFFHKQ